MRPVNKGTAPAVCARYQDAGPELRNRLGEYCSYCERQIETHLAVEHIQPKVHVPELSNTWSNLLLCCVHCNSCKADTAVIVDSYLWPDRDNTLRALDYVSGGIVEPNRTLPAVIQSKAQATIELSGLDKYPGNSRLERRPSSSDYRWLRRVHAWQLAERNRHLLTTNNSPEVRELIVETALARGMFSIWWTVFAGDADMRKRLRQAFTGTDPSCFDANEELQPRVGGQV